MNRDIVQFVQFNKHEYDRTSLTRATLEEIPDQLVQFFHSRGIRPQLRGDPSISKIVVDEYNEETDIDLSMDFQDDGEIVLNGEQPGAYIDNSYEAGLGGIKIMTPGAAAPGGAASAPTMGAGAQGYNPYAGAAATAPGMASAPMMAAPGMVPPTAPAMTAAAPAVAAPVPVPVPAAPQPFTFQVQVPPGVSPGMQIQVAHPQTGQPLVVAVPQGVPPGGVFSVSA